MISPRTHKLLEVEVEGRKSKRSSRGSLIPGNEGNFKTKLKMFGNETGHKTSTAQPTIREHSVILNLPNHEIKADFLFLSFFLIEFCLFKSNYIYSSRESIKAAFFLLHFVFCVQKELCGPKKRRNKKAMLRIWD